MKKIVRNMSTPESRAFWEAGERNSMEIRDWPAWKRAGINEAALRQRSRETPDEPQAKREDDE